MNTAERHIVEESDTEVKFTDHLHESDLTINEVVHQAYQTAKEKGWHDEPKSFGDDMALIHSEVSEALEAFRDNGQPTLMWYVGDDSKPEGVPSELADIVIRVADVCGKYGIDLESAIETKMAFNKTRPFRHGGKKL